MKKKSKRAIFIILALMMVFTSFPFNQGFAQGTNEIKIVVDGSLVESDQPPIMVNDRVLVPFRAILNALYADVEWIGETQTVFATKRFQTVSLSIGSNEIYSNGKTIPLDSPALLVNDRTLVPVRAISEGFEAEVSWDGETKTVYVESAQQEHYISDQYITEKIKSDDGQCELLKVSVSYPQIRNDKKEVYIDQLNKTFKTNAEKSFESLKEEYIPITKEFYNEVILNEPAMQSSNMPYEVTQRFDITYDYNDLLSVVTMFTWWTGGAHPNSMKTSATYDLQISKELALTDIFDKSQNEINAMVIETFTNDINEKPEYYFEDSKDTVAKEVEKAGYYLDEGGITFYFNPYDIAPYVAGYPSVGLTFDSKYGFFDRFIDAQLKQDITSFVPGHIKVATNAEFPPFEYIDEEGTIVGLDIEIANYIADKLGYEISWENTSFDSLINKLTSGECDMVIAGMSITEHRKEIIDFSSPYYFDKAYIVVPSNSKVKTVDDLKGKKIGTMGYTEVESAYAEKYDWIKNSVEKLDNTDHFKEAFMNGQIDAVIIESFYLDPIKDVDVNVIESIDIDNGYGIATQKGSPLTQQIEDVLNQMKADGSLNSIIEKYIPSLEK